MEDVTVPPDSRVDDKSFGSSFLSLYSFLNILPGTTMEIYCSGIVAFVKRQVKIVAVTSPTVDLILPRNYYTMASSIPVSSAIPPNIMAIIVREIEDIMLLSPPVVKSLSTDSRPVSETKPFKAADKMSPKFIFW